MKDLGDNMTEMNEECPITRITAERDKLLAAIERHHAQKADDRCHMDDVELYAAAGLPKADIRVGDKAAMLVNCERFIDKRCDGGKWPSYVELEATIKVLREALEDIATNGGARSMGIALCALREAKLR